MFTVTHSIQIKAGLNPKQT